MYTVAPVQQMSGYVPLHKRTRQQELKLKEHLKRHYNMRVTITLNDPDDNVERRTRLKEWMQVIHMIDNTFLVYKFNGNDDDDPMSLPDQLPHEDSDLELWFVDRRVHRNKFCFSVQTSGTSSYSYLRSKLYRWNSARGNFIKFDTIKAKRVAPIGWFSEYIVDLHNQHEFREEMERLICASGAEFSFTMYPRNVWENNGGERIKTRGLVMEVDSQRSNKIVDGVLRMRFTGNFGGFSARQTPHIMLGT